MPLSQFAIGELAERVRFELTVPVKGRQFSRLEQSTALPPLRMSRVDAAYYAQEHCSTQQLHPVIPIAMLDGWVEPPQESRRVEPD